jgi:hypothetical protein
MPQVGRVAKRFLPEAATCASRMTLKSVTKEADKIKRIETILSHSLSTFQITKASVLNLNLTGQPFGYRYSLVAENYAKNAGNLLLVRPRVLGSKPGDLLETKEPHQYPVEMPGPSRDTDTFEIALPAGYEVDDLPPPVDADYGFASYHSKTEVTGNTLKYTRTFEVKELSVPLNKVEELKKLYRIIAGDERNTAVLKPAGHLIQIGLTPCWLFLRGPGRPNSVGTTHQKTHKTQSEHGMAEARAEVLPEGGVRARIVRRKEQCQHQEKSSDARRPDPDTDH